MLFRSHPFWDPDDVHDVYREWRRIADSYDPPRIFVAEAWVPKPARLARYVRPDELHTTFNFDYLRCAWRADALRKVIVHTIREHDLVGAPPTWVLSNHDVMRHVSRYARFQQHDRPSDQLRDFRDPYDLELGARRARAALLLTMGLPGVAYVYQGEEMGVPEVEDLPPEVLQDPVWQRSGFTDTGRDGCRVPVPWAGTSSPFGFSAEPASAEPWLPQPAMFARFTAEVQRNDPASMLSWYRTVLAARRAEPSLRSAPLEWLDGGEAPTSLTFRRGDLVCVVNFGSEPMALPAHRAVIVSSVPLESGLLPADAAVWLRAK